jgi:hypothetical protein
MVSVAAKTGVSPGGIFGIRARLSLSTKPRKVPIVDPMTSQEALELRGVVLGLAPGAREAADVGHLRDPMRLEQVQKDFGWMDRVTNRVDHGRAHAG